MERCFVCSTTYTLSLGIPEEDFEAVDEGRSVERIAADADAQRLAETHLSGLIDGLVGERARARDDADDARLMYVTRHDANLALTWCNDARAVRSNESIY